MLTADDVESGDWVRVELEGDDRKAIVIGEVSSVSRADHRIYVDVEESDALRVERVEVGIGEDGVPAGAMVWGPRGSDAGWTVGEFEGE
jgi:multidrug efflux pump subunit AcrA (membrane-fusion protein)